VPASDWNTRIPNTRAGVPKPCQHGEHDAFREELPDDASRAGAHRGANRKLALPTACAHQHEIRDVAAGDEQHNRHRAHQQQQEAAAASDDLFVEGADGDLNVLAEFSERRWVASITASIRPWISLRAPRRA
jgi:hypothetical protein